MGGCQSATQQLPLTPGNTEVSGGLEKHGEEVFWSGETWRKAGRRHGGEEAGWETAEPVQFHQILTSASGIAAQHREFQHSRAATESSIPIKGLLSLHRRKRQISPSPEEMAVAAWSVLDAAAANLVLWQQFILWEVQDWVPHWHDKDKSGKMLPVLRNCLGGCRVPFDTSRSHRPKNVRRVLLD